MFDFDDFTDVYDFPEEYDSFRDFDNLLRCPICKEFLNPALILSSCQHYGCSYCMRKTIMELNICPMCRHPADATELQKVSLIDDIIKIYKNNRKIILELIDFKKNSSKTDNVSEIKQNSKITNHENELDSKEVIISDDGDTTMATITISDISSQVGTSEKDDNFLNDNNSQNIHDNNDINNNNNNNNNNINNNGNNGNNENNVNTNNNNNREFSSIQPSDDEFVQCPLCLQSIQVKRLNRHIDLGCPKENPPGESSNNPLSFFKSSSKSDNDSTWKDKIFSNPIVKPKTKNKIKKLRSLAYNLLTESKLRKILRDLKIPSHGDKSLMQKRHAEFVNLFNANCDLEHPKSHQRLVEELKRWEKINFEITSPFSKHNPYPKLFFSSKHNNHNNHNTHHGSINLSGSSQNDADLEELDKERQQYLQSHKSDFDYLISQIKKRGGKKGSSENTDAMEDKGETNEFIDYSIFNDDHSHLSFNTNNEKSTKNIKNKTIRKKQNESDDEYCEGSRPSKKARIRRKVNNVKTPTKRYNTRSSHVTLDEEDDKHSDISSSINHEGSSCSNSISSSNSNRNSVNEVYEILSSEDEGNSTMVTEEKNTIINNQDPKESVEEKKNIIDKQNYENNNNNTTVNEIQNGTKDDSDTAKKIKVEAIQLNNNVEINNCIVDENVSSKKNNDDIIDERAEVNTLPENIGEAVVDKKVELNTLTENIGKTVVDKKVEMSTLPENIGETVADKKVEITTLSEDVVDNVMDKKVKITTLSEDVVDNVMNKKVDITTSSTNNFENKNENEERNNIEDDPLNLLKINTHLQDISNEININNTENETSSNNIKSSKPSESSNEIINLISP